MPFEMAGQTGEAGGVPLYGRPQHQEPQAQNQYQDRYQGQYANQYQSGFQDKGPSQHQSQVPTWAASAAPLADGGSIAPVSEGDTARQDSPESLYDQAMEIPASFLFDQEQAPAQETSDTVVTVSGDDDLPKAGIDVGAASEKADFPEATDAIDIVSEGAGFPEAEQDVDE